MPGRFRLTDLDLEFISLVASGDDPMARVVISKASPGSDTFLQHPRPLGKVSSRAYPDLERKKGGPDNWVERAGGLPDYIERIAKHLHYEQGMSISHAIATAVSRCKKWAAGGEGVSAETRAKAAKAIAEWERKKANLNKSTSGASGSSTLPGNNLPEGNMPEQITKDDLDPQVREYIDALEAEVDTLAKSVEEKDSEITDLRDTLAKSTPKDAESAEAIEKSLLAKADPAVRALIEKQNEAIRKAEEVAKAERDARLNREYITKAESLSALPVEASEFAGVLRRAAEALDPQDVEKIDSVLKAANEALSKSDLFREVGQGGSQTTISKSVEAGIEAIRKEDPSLTKEQAEVEFYRRNPQAAQAALNGQEG